MRRTANFVLAAVLAGMIGFGTVSGTLDAAAAAKPTVLCPPAC